MFGPDGKEIGMPQISIQVSTSGIQHASHRLSREVARLEAAGKRITNIQIPTLVAETLGISLVQNTAFYRGYPALARDAAPQAIVIEHESPVRW
jgi:hypothetical protein